MSALLETTVELPARAIFGAGSSAQIGDEILRLGASSALLVTDDFMLSSGRAEPMKAAIEAAGVRCTLFADVQPDPTDVNVVAGLEVVRESGAEVIVASGENETARVRSALHQLGAAGVTSILLEGGPHLAGAFLDAEEIDEVRLFLAPLILGGRTARDPLEGEGVDSISEAVHATALTCERVDEDLLISARVREW